MRIGILHYRGDCVKWIVVTGKRHVLTVMALSEANEVDIGIINDVRTLCQLDRDLVFTL